MSRRLFTKLANPIESVCAVSLDYEWRLFENVTLAYMEGRAAKFSFECEDKVVSEPRAQLQRTHGQSELQPRYRGYLEYKHVLDY